MTDITEILVRRDDFSNKEIIVRRMPPLGEGQVRLAIESLAMTANNVTYALTGDQLKYWNFFPAPEGWGRVPFWGHSRVIESRHPEIAVGERNFGLIPMSTHLDIEVGDVAPATFFDNFAHRQPMARLYSQYRRLAADPGHDPDREDARMLFSGLYRTGFLVATMFVRERWFAANTVYVTSASSKTAMGFAHSARRMAPEIKRIGLTSKGNVEFVEGTQLYDSVVAYPNLAEIGGERAVLVDFAGNPELVRTIHKALDEKLAYSCLVGGTHWQDGAFSEAADVPGPKPIFFFAPHETQRMLNKIGLEEMTERIGIGLKDFHTITDQLIRIRHISGLAAGAEAFTATVEGKVRPDEAFVVQIE